MHPRRMGIALTLALTSLACSPEMLAQMSAEPTECPAERIEISDARQPWEGQGPSSWTATCTSTDGASQKWFCSKLHDRVICTEDPR